MKRGAIGLVAVAVVGWLAMSPSAQAQDMGRKFGRGFTNVVLGIVEIPRTVVEVKREKGVGQALAYGPIMGIGRFLGRELVGVHEMVTFPIPVPADYAPIMKPEYPWEMDGGK